MTWLLIAIIGQIILGTAAVVDKSLLRKRISDPVVYTFWIGCLGIFAAVLVPFGFAHLSYGFIILDIISGIIFISSLLVLYLGLSKIAASFVLPLTSAIIPLWTFVLSFFLINTKVTGMDIIGMLLLIIGALFFFFAEQKKMRRYLIAYAAASAGLYGLSVVFQKIVFEHSNFVTGFFWAKMGEVIGALLLLVLPQLRKRILNAHMVIGTKDRLWYLANRAWASLGSVLLNAAVFLAHPALVQSTQSFRYVVIFLAAWILLREHSRGKMLWLKIFASLFAIIGIIWLGVTAYARSIPIDVNRDITWGVTFSEKFSRRLGLDPKENLHAILQDLHPKNIRLVAYWDEIEPSPGIFDFSSLDWQLDVAALTNTHVILAMGMRVPRWPECFMPAWALGLSAQDRENAIRSYSAEIIKRYRGRPEIMIWQVENEPFLVFGFCPVRSNNSLEEEISLVHSLDNRPVLITDSGEFGTWYRAAKLGDVFGTSLYRKVYPPSAGPYIGELDYPLSPSFFRLKEKIIRFLLHDYAKPFIVIELQSEPWGKVEIPLLSVGEQVSLFTPDYFKETIEYAKETGFSDYYMWGAEWWYAMKIKNNDSRYWEIAKNLLRGN